MAKKSAITTKQALQKMSEGYELHISSLVASGRLFSYRLYASPSAIDPIILSQRVGEKVRWSDDVVRADNRIVAFTDVYVHRNPQPDAPASQPQTDDGLTVRTMSEILKATGIELEVKTTSNFKHQIVWKVQGNIRLDALRTTLRKAGYEISTYWTTSQGYDFILTDDTQPQTVTPADEAAPDDVVLRLLKDHGNPRFAQVYLTDEYHLSVDSGYDAIVVDGHNMPRTIISEEVAWAECDDVYPADRQPATSEPTADVLDGVERVSHHAYSHGYELHYANHTQRFVSQQVYPKEYAAIQAAIISQNWDVESTSWRGGTYYTRPQSPVASQPAESETIDQRLHQMYLDDRDEGYANSHPQTYTHWLEETINRMDKSIRYLHSKLDELEPVSANMAIASNILQDNANLREQLGAANRKLAAIRHEDMEAIGDMVYGGQPADDERKVYVEYEARFRQLDDHLYSADDVRRKMDDLEA